MGRHDPDVVKYASLTREIERRVKKYAELKKEKQKQESKIKERGNYQKNEKKDGKHHNSRKNKHIQLNIEGITTTTTKIRKQTSSKTFPSAMMKKKIKTYKIESRKLGTTPINSSTAIVSLP